MSVVVAKVRAAGGYTMAADSISVRGSTAGKTTKLERVGELDIGSCGYVEEHSLMIAFAQGHMPASAARRDVIEWLAEFRKWKGDRCDSKDLQNSYLVGFRGRVFHLGACVVVDDYEAIGAGMNFALAAMLMGRSAREAVEVAIELSTWCAGPVIELESGS